MGVVGLVIPYRVRTVDLSFTVLQQLGPMLDQWKSEPVCYANLMEKIKARGANVVGLNLVNYINGN